MAGKREPSPFLRIEQRGFAYGNAEVIITNPNNNYSKTKNAAICIGCSMLLRALYPEAENYPKYSLSP